MPIREITIDKIPDARAALSLIQGEGRAQIVRFVIDRYDGGVDLSGLSWCVKAVNAAGDSDVYMLDAPTFDDKTLTVDWLAHGVATAVAGETRFELQGVAEADGPVVWKNGTRTIKVYESLDAEPSLDDEQLTELQTLILHVRNELEGVISAGEAAGKAAADADAVRANVETAEAARAQEEQARADAETRRMAAEAGRADAEAGRADAEERRADAEAQRNAAEAGRVAAEEQRASAEQNRRQEIDALQSRVEQAEMDVADKLPTTPTDWPEWSADAQAVARSRIGIHAVTQAEYDALTDASGIYIIMEE